MKNFLILLLLVNIQLLATAQAVRRFNICVTAFYNLENLYDTINNPMVNDDEFTPGAAKKYGKAVYVDKINRLAQVIEGIAIDKTKDGVAILGVAEVENDTVLKDLIAHPLLKKRNYQFIHYDSKDSRGIDVALLYNPIYFKPESSKPIPVTIKSASAATPISSRDILMVKGILNGERIYILVNHWPSKKGGEDQSSVSRNIAAKICKEAIQEIQRYDQRAKILVMGDLNDNPDSWSVQKILEATDDIRKIKEGQLYNPWMRFYRQGLGSLANQDSWSLFDQIMLTSAWLEEQREGFRFYQAQIYKPVFLIENRGRYRGYPMRTWDGNNYRGGYSDHFPTYLLLIKNLK